MKKIILKSILLVLAMGFAGGLPVLAQSQAPPEGSSPKAFTVPVSQSYILANGLKVTLVPYGIIPKATISVAVDAGNLNEGKNRVGVADLTGDLFKEGTAGLTARQLAEETSRMGSSLEVNVGADQTKFELDVLQEFAPDAVRLIGDVLQHPRFPETELARLKNDMLRRIALETSQPQTIAAIRFRKLLYGEHPYATILPTEDDVKKLALQDVKDYYSSNFGAQRSHIYVAGRFDATAVKSAIAESFSGWAKGPLRIENPPRPATRRVLDITDRPGAPQSTLMLGLPVPGPQNPDSIPLGVANCTLGWLFQFADHLQHPRTKGIYLLAIQ